MCGILNKLLTSYHVLNLKFPSHSLTIKFFLAFSEINQEYQYSFFIFVRLAYMLNYIEPHFKYKKLCYKLKKEFLYLCNTLAFKVMV